MHTELRTFPVPATFETFILSEGNRHAYQALRFFVDQPECVFRTVWLHGPSGSGKSHLLHSIESFYRTRHSHLAVRCFEAGQFHRDYIRALQERRMEAFRSACRDAEVFLMDDIQTLANKTETQGELLRTIHSLLEQRRKIIFTSDAPMRNLKRFASSFASRVPMDMEIRMDRLDEAGRIALLEQHGGKVLAPPIRSYLLRSIPENTKDLLKCLHHILRSGRRTPESARETVERYLSFRSEQLTFEDVARAVSNHTGVSLSDLSSRNRSRDIAWARHACFYLCKKHMPASFEEIGRHFGDRDHTTVMAGCARISENADHLRSIQPIEVLLAAPPSKVMS